MKVGDIVKTRPGFWPVVVCIVFDKQKGIFGENTARLYCFQHKRYFWEGNPKRRFEVISKKLA
jgi:hypothetical protein